MRNYKFVLIAGALAVMLLGCGAAAYYLPPMERPFGVGGIITMIDLHAGTITLNGPVPVDEDGVLPEPITFMVNDRTRIVKDGRRAHLADLAIGDACRALLVHTPDGGLLALGVIAESPSPPLTWVHGKIVKISLPDRVFALALITNRDDASNSADHVILFYVDHGTRICKDGRPAWLRDLHVGDLARVGFAPPPDIALNRPIRAAIVIARTPPPPMERFCGRISSINYEDMTIAVVPLDIDCFVDCSETFKITEQTKIDKFGVATIKDLCVGDRVCVTYNPFLDVYPPYAIGVRVIPEKYGGTIVRVDPAAGLVWCAGNSAGELIVFRVCNKTRIFRNGRPVPLEALRPRDFVHILFYRYEHGNVASLIHARGHYLAPR